MPRLTELFTLPLRMQEVHTPIRFQHLTKA